MKTIQPAIGAKELVSEWQRAIEGLFAGIDQWSQAASWSTERSDVQKEERPLGSYSVPVLTVSNPNGTVYFEPVARFVSGGSGSVEMYAWPSLYRVRLIRGDDKSEWRILTDSGIFLRQDWNNETFLTLVNDLLSAQ
ncbi:MAG: hypothetical protein ACLQVD_10660 [Capsulimonadaceae bacterium]